MMKKSRTIVFITMIFSVFCLCSFVEGGTVVGRAAQETVSMTEFYNNGLYGIDYEKARMGAIVTISNVEEMRLFFNCLYNSSWTSGISFRQEVDISFSNFTFSYDPKNRQVLINQGGFVIKCPEYSMDMQYIQSMGLAGACIEVEAGRDFCGRYDGQGYSISGFILTGSDSRNSGIFSHVAEMASITRLKLKNCFLNNACGAFCGFNEGTITDCSAEYILGIGWWLGGLAESNGGMMLRCKLDYGLLYVRSGRVGGIVATSYGGTMSDCAVEHLRIMTSTENSADMDVNAGGIAGYQTGGRINSCSSFCDIICPRDGQKNVGGIVGCVEDDILGSIVGASKRVKSEINNCFAIGRFYGRTVGGIVGRIGFTESAFEVSLKNNFNLAMIGGTIVGGTVGLFYEGQAIACYSDRLQTRDVVGYNIAGKVTDCYAVTREQVYGVLSADVIGADSTYSNTNKLLTALNNGVADTDYLKWKLGYMGYPILVSNLREAPEGDYILGIEIETFLLYHSEDEEKPVASATPEATVKPTPDATVEATTASTPDATSEATPKPTPDTTSEVTAKPTPEVTPDASFSPAVTVPPSNKENLIKNLAVKNLKAKLQTSLHVKLSWNKNQWADGYHILRSSKDSSGYKMIGTISASFAYVDKTVKRGHTYYYMVRGYAKNTDSTVIYGEGQKKKAQVAWHQAPVLRLTSGRTSDGKAYVQVGVSKYSGSYVEVYFKRQGQGYVKAPLKNKKIAFYKGKLRFSYETKSLLYCKVRTYQLKKGKKYYSAFSEERAIQL